MKPLVRALAFANVLAVAQATAGCALPLGSFGRPPSPRSVGTDGPDPEALPPLPPPRTTSAAVAEPPPGGIDAPPPAETPWAPNLRAPAVHYAALSGEACEAELTRRGGRFTRDQAPGVAYPIRLTGPLSGVVFRSMLSPAQRRTTPYEILDCRLALAVDDFARVLARHGVVEVVHYSMWRPADPKKPREGPGRRHPGGLAIDAALFKFDDGRVLSVDKDFHGSLGSKPCGSKVNGAPGELRDVYCEAATEGMFNVMLSPHYNRAHKNHFHLEVTTGVKWTLVR